MKNNNKKKKTPCACVLARLQIALTDISKHGQLERAARA
jgi:hypothetical protein